MKELAPRVIGDREVCGVDLIAAPAATPGRLRFRHDVFGSKAKSKEREFVAEAPAVGRAKMAREVPPFALVRGMRGVIAWKVEDVGRLGDGERRGCGSCRRAGQDDGCDRRDGRAFHSVRTASAVWMRAATCAG